MCELRNKLFRKTSPKLWECSIKLRKEADIHSCQRNPQCMCSTQPSLQREEEEEEEEEDEQQQQQQQQQQQDTRFCSNGHDVS